jgi:hypothetical protein
MKEPGEPNMGNLYVRFDEGRESVGHWLNLSTQSLLPTLQPILAQDVLPGNGGSFRREIESRFDASRTFLKELRDGCLKAPRSAPSIERSEMTEAFKLFRT